MAASGVAGGTEEVWNVKELVRRIGSALASDPKPQELSWVQARIGTISEPLQAKVGDLISWIERFHSGSFKVEKPGEDKVLIYLTEDGLSKYSARAPTADQHEDPEESNAREVPALAAELRDKVFDELRAEAERRKVEGRIYYGAKKVAARGSGSLLNS